MTRYWNGFEGQTAGTTVTAANSATSGTAFSTVTIGTGATLTYATAAAHGGTLGMQAVYADTTSANVYLALAPATATTRVAARAYVSFTDTATASTRVDQFLTFRTGAGSVGYLNMANTGAFILTDTTGVTLTSSPVAAPGTVYRLEVAATVGATAAAGLLEAAIYLGDSTTAWWTASVTANLGTAALTILRVGRSNTTGFYARTVNFDGIAVDDAFTAGFIGPPVAVTVAGTATPPKVTVAIAADDGTALTAVTLSRTANGQTTPTRVQPGAGTASAYVEDVDADWDTPLVYTATYTSTAGTVTMTSATVTLTPSPVAMWAIHPLVPALSTPLDPGDPTQLGVAGIGDITRASLVTKHRPIGSSLQVVTKVGNRAAPSGTLTLTTTTQAELTDLLTLTTDETPILIRCPAAWGWAWEDGYYALGDIVEARRVQWGPEASRTVTLPYERVAQPAGQQASSWSWADILATYPDWPSVLAAYGDWPAVIGNNAT